MTDVPDCPRQFIVNLLTDLGLDFFQIGAIGFKLSAVIRVYNDNRSNTNLNTVANELYNCVQPYLDNSAIITGEEIGFLIIYFSIITAITVLIIVIIIITLKPFNKAATIGIVIGICLFYIIIGWLLIQNTYNIISNSILNSENKIIDCVNTAINKLDNFIIQDESAIDKGLCAYP